MERTLTTYIVIGAIVVSAITALGTLVKALTYRVDPGSAPTNGWDFGVEAIDTAGSVAVAALGR